MTPPLFWNDYIVRVSDIAKKEIRENSDPIVVLQDLTDEVLCKPISERMKPYVGDRMVVRSDVALRLIRAASWIKERRPTLTLCLTYGYRHPDVQSASFNQKLGEYRAKYPGLSDDELHAKTNECISDPRFAGHPTGGAVDCMLYEGEEPAKFGTMPTVFGEDVDPKRYYPFSDCVTPIERGNRLFLREAMMTQGFAPFNAEWWHFSYGDRDWASFYGERYAFYDSVSFAEVSELLS